MNIIYEFIFVSIFFLIVYLFKLKKKEGKGGKRAKKEAKKAKKEEKKERKKREKKAKKRAKKERKKGKKRARKTEKKKPKKFDFIRDVKKSIYFWKFFSFKWFRFNNKNNERSWTDTISDIFNFILNVIKKLWNILINIKDIDFYKFFKSLFIFLIFIFYWQLCLLTGLIIFSIQIFKFVGNFFSGIWNEIKKLF